MSSSLTVTVDFLNTQKVMHFITVQVSGKLRIISICIHMCVCVFACTHFCKWIHTCMWRPENTLGIFLQALSTLSYPLFETGSCWHTRLAGPWALKDPCICLSRVGTSGTYLSSYLSFYTEFWGLNIGFCACKISPLLTVLSSQPYIFLKISILSL